MSTSSYSTSTFNFVPYGSDLHSRYLLNRLLAIKHSQSLAGVGFDLVYVTSHRHTCINPCQAHVDEDAARNAIKPAMKLATQCLLVAGNFSATIHYILLSAAVHSCPLLLMCVVTSIVLSICFVTLISADPSRSCSFLSAHCHCSLDTAMSKSSSLGQRQPPRGANHGCGWRCGLQSDAAGLP